MRRRIRSAPIEVRDIKAGERFAGLGEAHDWLAQYYRERGIYYESAKEIDLTALGTRHGLYWTKDANLDIWSIWQIARGRCSLRHPPAFVAQTDGARLRLTIIQSMFDQYHQVVSKPERIKAVEPQQEEMVIALDLV